MKDLSIFKVLKNELIGKKLKIRTNYTPITQNDKIIGSHQIFEYQTIKDITLRGTRYDGFYLQAEVDKRRLVIIHIDDVLKQVDEGVYIIKPR